jgi:DNA-binding transcriptional LysR family regulator
LAREHPALRIELVQESGDDLIEHVKSDAIDLAVTSSRNVPRELLFVDLGTNELSVVEAAHTPCTKAQSVSLRELARNSIDP